MEKHDQSGSNRREFLGKVIPACTILCAGFGSALAGSVSEKDFLEFQEKHKFDSELPIQLPLRDYFKRVSSVNIKMLEEIGKEIGEEKLLGILRRSAYKNGLTKGEQAAKRYPDKDFHSYNERFRGADSFAKTMLTYDIVEDSEKAFEIKVTECVVVEAYIEAGAGKYANANLCNEDFSHAEGYNPKIKLIRDKTLTLGHGYCNHRYVLET